MQAMHTRFGSAAAAQRAAAQSSSGAEMSSGAESSGAKSSGAEKREASGTIGAAVRRLPFLRLYNTLIQ